MKNGCTIEYGGFVMDRKSGKEKLLYVTRRSKLKCAQKTIKHAEFYNKTSRTNYDIDTFKIRYRKVEEYVGPWRNNEKSAFDEQTLASEAVKPDEPFAYVQPAANVRKWISDKVKKEKLTSSSKVACRWTENGQFVDIYYIYDHFYEIPLESYCLYEELYEEGSPCKDTWEEALCIGKYISLKYNIPFLISLLKNWQQ